MKHNDAKKGREQGWQGTNVVNITEGYEQNPSISLQDYISQREKVFNLFTTTNVLTNLSYFFILINEMKHKKLP